MQWLTCQLRKETLIAANQKHSSPIINDLVKVFPKQQLEKDSKATQYVNENAGSFTSYFSVVNVSCGRNEFTLWKIIYQQEKTRRHLSH